MNQFVYCTEASNGVGHHKAILSCVMSSGTPTESTDVTLYPKESRWQFKGETQIEKKKALAHMGPWKWQDVSLCVWILSFLDVITH